jgi:hypothetical protein
MEDEQDLVARILRSTPTPDVGPGFVARVNARIDAEKEEGWLGLADFRLWTLRLAPAAAALGLIAALWSASAQGEPETTATAAVAVSTFSPSSLADWESDVSGDALLEAALTSRGGADAR